MAKTAASRFLEGVSAPLDEPATKATRPMVTVMIPALIRMRWALLRPTTARPLLVAHVGAMALAATAALAPAACAPQGATPAPRAAPEGGTAGTSANPVVSLEPEASAFWSFARGQPLDTQLAYWDEYV